MLSNSTHRLPKVALVGRINVGKSTLFNRLIEKRAALVSPIPGTTRDRKENICEWRGVPFILVDTGGVEKPSRLTKKTKNAVGSGQHSADLSPLITAQTEQAIKEATLILLVTDAHDGPLPQDQRWAEALRGRKPTIVIVNKVDNTARAGAVPEFYKLGLGEPQPVSGANGRGSGDLLDRIVSILKKHQPIKTKKVEPHDLTPVTPDISGFRGTKPRTVPLGTGAWGKTTAPPITLAILGQPNSGKSTLLNAILGEERVIVSPTPHTTREPQDIPFAFKEHELILVDTAGIRRKAHVTTGVERQGVSASLKTVNRSDVVVLVIDALREPTVQDQRLARYVVEHGKGLILAINKWDLVADKTPHTMQIVTHQMRQLLPGLDWVPIIFISAKNKQRVTEMLEMALGAKISGQLALSEETLMDFLKIVVKKHRPTKAGGVRHPKILSFKQVHADPPRFEVTALGELHPSYLKFLENRLREHFGFTGAPIAITLKTKRKQARR